MISVVRLDVVPIHESNKRFMLTVDRQAVIALLRSVNVKTFVEIGVNYGFTASVILDNIPEIERYIGIDVHADYVPAMKQQADQVPNEPGKLVLSNRRFELILQPRGSFDVKPEDIGQCDAMLIDGDHGRAGVVNDTALARACVRSGGVIIWHDYHKGATEDVRDVLDEFAVSGAPIKHVEGTWVAFERV